MTSENKMREAQEALEFILDMAASSAGNIGGEEQVEHCGNIIRAALHSVEAEKDAEWLRLEVVGPELGEDVDIWLFDGSILIGCQIQTDGDFYCNAIFGEFFVCASNVVQWKPTSPRTPRA